MFGKNIFLLSDLIYRALEVFNEIWRGLRILPYLLLAMDGSLFPIKNHLTTKAGIAEKTILPLIPE